MRPRSSCHLVERRQPRLRPSWCSHCRHESRALPTTAETACRARKIGSDLPPLPQQRRGWAVYCFVSMTPGHAPGALVLLAVAHEVGEEQQASILQTSGTEPLKTPVTVPDDEIVPEKVDDIAPPQVTAEVGTEKLPLETATVNV